MGADRAPVANRVSFVGSIKWHNSPVDARELAELRRSAAHVPGMDPATAGLVVVSLSGVEATDPVDLVWSPRDIVSAWRP